ncbi:hypothetical protein Tco_0221223 [Tanacetum coccineum]
MSSIAKFDVKKFDGSNDFGLWRVKMRCLLIQHGREAALDPFPETMTDADKTAALKTDVYKKAHNPALLSSGLIMSKGKEYTNPSSLAKRQEPSPIHASEKETITAPFTHANPPKKIKEYAS